MNKTTVFLIFMLLIGSKEIHATTSMNEEQLQNQVNLIAKNLKCLVCAGQSVQDSNAEFAINIRRDIRQSLIKGISQEQIKRNLIEKYGIEILYTPPKSDITWILWYGPYLIFALTILCIFIIRRRPLRNI